MLEVTTLGNSTRTFLPDNDAMCASCENNRKGADQCKFNHDGSCNYVPKMLTNTTNTIRCRECIYATRKDDMKSHVSTYECSIGKFFADCNAFVAKDNGIPLPPVETEKPTEEKRMTHHIKIRESFAEAVYLGIKTFEVRKNDRGYQKGDLVQFTVLYDSDGLEMISHPLRNMTFEITYVLAGWGIEDGYVVFGIKKIP